MSAQPSADPPIDAGVLRGLLAHRDPGLLSAVLDAAHVAHDGVSEGSEALADRVVGALWCGEATPRGM